MKAYVQQQHIGIQESWELDFHVHDGKNQDIISDNIVPGEIFVIGEALAESQELATALADTARIATVVSFVEPQFYHN